MSNMPSVMQHNFSRVPQVEIPRSKFDRTFAHKTTFDAGYLIPIYRDEALPGDTFSLRMSAFCRLATPLHPIMDNLRLSTFFFSVPIRLIWDNWQKFNGEQRNPGDTTDFLVPTVTSAAGGFPANSLWDYLGLPTVNQVDPAATITVDAFWSRAYNLIYNDWFRDQNLQNSVVVDVDDGPDTLSDYVLKKRGKRHDYFTSCLPWPQKGPSVELPLLGNAPVKGIGFVQTPGPAANRTVRDSTSTPGGPTTVYPASVFGSDTNQVVFQAQSMATNTPPMIYADMTDVASATINQLRQSIQIQVLYERDARGGTRYTEIIRSHFGVTSPDARLQRPEFLGGGVSYVNIHPVVQQSASTEDSPQGNLAAFGTVSVKNHGFTQSFTEHCVVLGFACLTADLTYQQGLHRMFTRQTRFDFYWPALANIGEQAVLSREIYCDGTGSASAGTGDWSVFGYQERFAEYRYYPSMITGEYRSSFPQSLDVWHLAQDFGSRPVLGNTFISEDPPIDRVIAVTDEPHVLFDGYFQLHSARPMPVYGVPGGITRF